MQIVIVGAGFAGVATAYHLSRRGVRDILVVEREAGPGMQASGKNAGLLRQSSHDPVTAGLLRRGLRAAKRHLRGVPGALLGGGSLILGARIDAFAAGPRARLVEAGEVVEGLAGRALHDPEDAIVDPAALLSVYEQAARRRGVRFEYGTEVQGVTCHSGGVRDVHVNGRRIAASVLVVAAGAWAGTVAAMAGSTRIPIEPRRRHLFRGELADREVASWPFVWDEDRGVYFRPEGAGLLASPCDETPHPAMDPIYDEGQRDRLAGKLLAAFGSLGEWRLGSGWPCLRTFTTDRRFLIGPDPDVEGLFWVAALGGHGVTASWAVGRLAARVLLGEESPGEFDPARVVR